MDIATLGLNVDSRQAATAVKVLDDLAAAGGRAEKSTDKLTGATKAQSSAADQYLQRLRDEVATTGKSRAEVEAYRSAMAGLTAEQQKSAAAMGAQIDRANAARNATNGLGQATRVLGQALAALGIATTLRELVGMADAYTNINSRLGLVTSSTHGLATAQKALFNIAQETRTGYADLVGTYAQMARSAKEFGASQNTMLGVTRTLSQAITISGASATSANAALVQLSQGFASGVLRGEELNSVMEQTPRVAQAIAEGMGVTTGKLREMGQAGMLTASAVVAALTASASSVDAEFGKMAVTVEQSITRVSNSMLRLVGEFDKLTGSTRGIAYVIGLVSTAADTLATSFEKLGAQGPLRQASSEVLRLDEYARNLRNGMKNGVFNPAAEAQLARVNAQLAEAKARFRDLDRQYGQVGKTDPRDQSGYKGRGQSYVDELARQTKLQEQTNDVMLKAAGVSSTYRKEMAEIIRLNQEGVLVGDRYQKVLQQMQEGLLKKTGATKEAKDAEREANKEAREANKEARERAKLIAENAGLSASFAEDWERLTKIYTDSSGVVSIDALTAAQGRLLAKQPAVKAASDAAAKAAKEEAKGYDEAAKARLRMYETMEGNVDKLEESNTRLREEIELIGLTTEQQYAVIRARNDAIILTAEAELAEIQRHSVTMKVMSREEVALIAYIEKLRERNSLLSAKESREASARVVERQQKQWIDMWESVDKTAHDVFVSVADEGMGAFERIGKTLKASILDVLYQMTVRRWVMSIFANIVGTGGGIAGVAGAKGGAGSVMDIASLANMAYGVYGTGAAGMVGSAVGSIFGTAAGNAALGTTLGLGSSSSIAAANAASLAGGGSGVLGLGGMGSSSLGALAGGGAFAAVAALVLNALGAFRSERKVGSGITGTLGSGQITPWEEWREGGTLFGGPSYSTMNPVAELAQRRQQLKDLRSSGQGGTQQAATLQLIIDKLEAQYGDLADQAEAQSKAIQDAYSALRINVADMADVLGISSEAVRKFTTQLGDSEKGLNFEGLSSSEIQQKIAEALSTANNELAKQVIGRFETTTSRVVRTVEENIGGEGENRDIVYREEASDVTTTRYIASEFARTGEEAIDTLTRLSVSLSTVNTVFDTLGVTLLEASVSGGDAASAFADAFGGLERMATLTQEYYQRYYTSEERASKTREQMEKQFAELGIEVPADKDEYRKLVNDTLSQVEVQRASKTAIVAALSATGGNFADVVSSGALGAYIPGVEGNPEAMAALEKIFNSAAEMSAAGKTPEQIRAAVADMIKLDESILGAGKDAAETAAKLMELGITFDELEKIEAEAAKRRRDNAYSALEKAIAAEQAILRAQIDALVGQRNAQRDILQSLVDIFDLLGEEIRSLQGEITGGKEMQAAQGRAFISAALNTARVSGYLPDIEQLSEAISAARSTTADENFVSRFEADRDRAMLAAELSDLQQITGKQKTVAELTLEGIDEQITLIEKQIKQNEEILKYWKEQIDKADGNIAATLSVADAVKALTAMMFPDKTPGGDTGGQKPTFGGGGGQAQPESKKYKYGVPVAEISGVGTIYEYETDADRIAKLDSYAPTFDKYRGTGDLAGLAADIKAQGGTAEDLAYLYGFTEKDVNAALDAHGIPRFEVGTNYVPSDGLAYLHEGEAVVPKEYNPAAGAVVNSAPNAQLMDLLRQIEANTRANAIKTHSINQTLNRVSIEGDALTVRIAA